MLIALEVAAALYVLVGVYCSLGVLGMWIADRLDRRTDPRGRRD